MFEPLFVTLRKVQLSLINCKKKYCNYKRVLTYENSVRFHKYQKLLGSNLQIKLIDATRILLKQPQVFNLSEEYLIGQCQWCSKLNIDVSTLHKDPHILFLPRKTLENQVMLLQDLGVSRDQPIIMPRFQPLMELRMQVFKGFMKIPTDYIVANNLLSLTKKPPKNVQPLQIPSEDLSVANYYNHYLQWYIQWKLNVPKNNENETKRIVDLLKNTSLSIMEQLFDIYHDEIGLTIQEIKEHQCMVNSSPSNLRLIIDEAEIFNGQIMKKLIKQSPKLCKMEYENVVKVVKLLERHDYAEIAIQRYPEILLIGASELAFKFQEFDNAPELRVLKNNILSMGLVLHQYNQCQLRLSYLRYMNIKYASVRVLSSSNNSFESFLSTGVDNTRAREICRSFRKVFNMSFREFMTNLRKHPYWNRIDLVSMHEATNFLLKKKYTTEEIFDNLPIILYPREKIAVTLKSMRNIIYRRKSKDGVTRREYMTKKQILALCLYRMELEFHFSGDGVWREENLIPKRTKPLAQTTETSECELSDCSDMENDETGLIPST
ncbi:transcription termination factor 5, mitochondrial isoform X2 [Venturia canescens]|uniref:transcription termination factor 5, mitochondrial isoform X2 n=1 Tax=Venturia canescens TaxID=32260 RepID=UPI001C9C4789|nr:transcription termination factor 5, mitochondrial isoform X2 [Venturia canescens]